MPKVNVLRNLKVREVSSVDRGAGKGVRVMLMKRRSTAALPVAVEEYLKRNVIAEAEAIAKREFSAEERREAARRGQALPSGGFPIENASDLRNAVQAFGRAKNPSAAKEHIRRRARALGLTDQLPASWSDGKEKKLAEKALIDTAAALGEVQTITKCLSFTEALGEMASPSHPLGLIQAVKTAGHALKDSVRSIDCAEEIGPAEKAKEIANSYRQFIDHLAGIAPGGIVKAFKAGAPRMSKLEKKLAKAFTSVGQGSKPNPPAKDGDLREQDAPDPAAGTGNDDQKTTVDKKAAKKLAKALEAAATETALWKRRATASLLLEKAAKEYMDHPDNDMDEDEKLKFLDLSVKKRVEYMDERPLAKMTEKRIAALPEDVRKKLEAGDAAASQVAKMAEEREIAEFGKRAVEIGQPVEFGKSMRLLAKGLGTAEEREKAVGELETAMKALVAQARTAGLFKEIGSGRAVEGSAEAQLYAKRDEVLAEVSKTNAKMTPEQAFSKVYEDPANRELVAQYKQEQRRRAA